jgi:molecular chaperone DnaK (HSP70)
MRPNRRAKFEELNLKHFNQSIESVDRVLKDAKVRRILADWQK